MTSRNQLIAVFVMYLLLFSAALVPANAATVTASASGIGESLVNFNMMGEYSPRSRCRDEAKRMWKRCRERDRRPNDVCDLELARRRRECDRYR